VWNEMMKVCEHESVVDRKHRSVTRTTGVHAQCL